MNELMKGLPPWPKSKRDELESAMRDLCKIISKSWNKKLKRTWANYMLLYNENLNILNIKMEEVLKRVKRYAK